MLPLYLLKWFDGEKFNNVRNGCVVCTLNSSPQNENGPCPLIALSNVLLLSRRVKIAPGETIISSFDLMDLLGSCLLESSQPYHSDAEHAANYQQNMQDAITVFPKLQTGLDVNVKFNRCACMVVVYMCDSIIVPRVKCFTYTMSYSYIRYSVAKCILTC